MVRCVIAKRHRRSLAAGLLAVLYAASGIRRSGRARSGWSGGSAAIAGVLEPGLHFRLPPPFEQVDPDRAGPGAGPATLGFRGPASTRGEPLRWEASHGRSLDPGGEDDGDALLLTGDGQFLEIAASLQYPLDTSRPGVAPPVRPRRRRARGGAPGAGRGGRAQGRRPPAAARPADHGPARGRSGRDRGARRTGCELLDLGVRVHGITFQDVHPPLAVVDAYRDVSRAESDRQRRINEADAYRAEKLAEAEARARAIVNAAQADRDGSSRWPRARPTRSATSSPPATRLPP